MNHPNYLLGDEQDRDEDYKDGLYEIQQERLDEAVKRTRLEMGVSELADYYDDFLKQYALLEDFRAWFRESVIQDYDLNGD